MISPTDSHQPNSQAGTNSAEVVLAPLAPRIRFMGITTGLMFCCLWVFNFAPWNDLIDQQGTPLGGDFPMFYVGGQIVAEGDVSQLYSLDEHHRRLRTLFPSLGKEDLLPYRYPPFVAGMTSPLARLPYGWAWGLFALMSIALAAYAWLALQQIQPATTEFQRAASLALCGWPVALEVIVGGQASFFALAIAAGSILLLTRQREASAGAVLALALYKPNVLILFVLGCLIRFPRMLLGFLPVAILLGIATIATVGWEGCLAYCQLGRSLVQTSWDIPTPFWKIHGLISWFDFWLPSLGRPIVVASGIAAVGIWAWKCYGRRDQSADETTAKRLAELALLLTLNTLFNPYPPIYDLVLLVIPAWISLRILEQQIARQASSTETLAIGKWSLTFASAAALFFFGPHLSQALSWQWHGQVFTLVLVVWAAWQSRQLFQLSKSNDVQTLKQQPIAIPHLGNQ